MRFLEALLRRRRSVPTSGKPARSMKTEVDLALLHTACRRYASSCLWLLKQLAGPRADFIRDLEAALSETRPTPLEAHDALRAVQHRVGEAFEKVKRDGTWLQQQREHLIHTLIDALQDTVKINNDLGAFDSQWQAHVINSLKALDFEQVQWSSSEVSDQGGASSKSNATALVPIAGQGEEGQTVRLRCHITEGELTVTGWKYQWEALPAGRIILTPAEEPQKHLSRLEFNESTIDLRILLQDDVWIFANEANLSLVHRKVGAPCSLSVSCVEGYASNLQKSFTVLSPSEHDQLRQEDEGSRGRLP